MWETMGEVQPFGGRKTKEEIQQARTVSLARFLLSYGIALKPGKQGRMKITDYPNIEVSTIGDGKWFCSPLHKYGDGIDFIQTFLKVGFGQAIDILNGKAEALAKKQFATVFYDEIQDISVHAKTARKYQEDAWDTYRRAREEEKSERKQQAKEVNLPDWMRANGLKLKRIGRREYCLKEHPSLTVHDNPVGEEGKWYWHSHSIGGDNIAFVREYFNVGFWEAVDMLTGHRSDYTLPPPRMQEDIPDIKGDPEVIPLKDNHIMYEYLCNYRKIPKDVIDILVENGTLVQEKNTNHAAFLYFDKNHKLIGAERVGTNPNIKYKRAAKFSDGTHGFEFVLGKGEIAMFFESAIDLLSYYVLGRERLSNARLISMSGVKESVVENAMNDYGIPQEKCYICADNDTAGDKLYERVTENYPKVQRIICDDKYKDWNDQLRNIPKTKR